MEYDKGVTDTIRGSFFVHGPVRLMKGEHTMADKIFYSNCIYDGLGDEPFPGGVAVSGNKIVAVGNRGEIEAWQDEKTEIYEYGDSMIMPGIFENHMHFFSGAMAASEYCCNDLLTTTSEEDCVERMRLFREAHPGLSKYVGNGWLTISWGNAELPTKRSLDRVFPDVPVYMISADSHSVWLNSKALEEFETDEISPDIVRFPDGELTGVFKENQIGRILNAANAFPEKDSMRIQKHMTEELNKWGITSAGECSGGLSITGPEMYDKLEELEKDGKLTVRLFLYSGILNTTNEKALERIRHMQERFHSDILCSNGFKIFVDGVSATYTAAMLEPYTDKPDICGEPVFPVADITQAVVTANKAGYPVRIHACGDYGVRIALDAFEEAQKEGASNNLRNAVEHIDIIHPDDIGRFRKLNVTASVQPCHVPQDAGEKIIRNGLERCRYEWPFRSILDTGAVLAMGTDYPVETFNPFRNIYMAMTRCDLMGHCTCPNPEQAMTLSEALRGYTSNGAFLQGKETVLGSLTAGKYADIAIIDRNLFQVPADAIKDTEVLMTVMNGQIVYRKES